MPARGGGNPALSNAAVRAAVGYMAGRSKPSQEPAGLLKSRPSRDWVPGVADSRRRPWRSPVLPFAGSHLRTSKAAGKTRPPRNFRLMTTESPARSVRFGFISIR